MDPRKVVGATGFEPATPCAQGRCATRLRYAPTSRCSLDSNALSNGTVQSAPFAFKPSTVAKLCQNPDQLTSPVAKPGRSSLAVPVELLQGLALHLQLHLRVLLEHLRIALAKQLGDPLVRHAAGAQPRGVGRAQVVDPKIRNLCSPQRRRPRRLERRLVSGRILVAGKQERSRSQRSRIWSRNAFDGELGQRHLSDPFGVFESGIQTTAFSRSTCSFLIGVSSL